MAQREDLLVLVAPLAKALRRIEDVAAARQGLTMWQYAILAVACERPGLSQAEVADVLQYSRNRIIADLDVLEERSLVSRRPGQDRRVNQLGVTDRGRRLMQQVRVEIRREEDVLLQLLSQRQRRDFVEALGTLAAVRR